MTQAYSFLNVQVTLAGPGGVLSLGYGASVADEGITLKAVGDKNKMTPGADGEVMHSLLADKTAKAEVSLLKTSPMNAQLMAMYDAQAASSTLWGQNLLTVSMNGVGDIHTGRQVAFTKRPDIAYAKEGDMIKWELDIGKLDAVLGTY